MGTFVEPLSAVSAAIVAALSDAAFLALCPGGAVDSVPQVEPTDANYPLLLYVVTNARQRGGLGSMPGRKTLPEIQILLHVYSLFQGMQQCQQVLGAAIDRLKTAPVVDGYSSWAIFWDSETPLPNELLVGVTVQELVAQGRLYVEEAA